MFWAGIIGDELFGPFRVPEGVKLTSKSHTAFLNEHLTTWLDDLPLAQLLNLIFMHYNAPSHVAKATKAFLGSICITGDNLMIIHPVLRVLTPLNISGPFWR